MNACFAVLGGFKDTLRVGTGVTVIGEGMAQFTGTIVSISEQRGVANIALDDRHAFGTNQILEVPLSRLRPPEVDTLPLKQLGIEKELCEAIKCVLGTSPVSISNPHTGMDAGSEDMALVRLYSELRSRACMCLSRQYEDSEEFKELFVSECNNDLNQLRKQVEC